MKINHSLDRIAWLRQLPVGETITVRLPRTSERVAVTVVGLTFDDLPPAVVVESDLGGLYRVTDEDTFEEGDDVWVQTTPGGNWYHGRFDRYTDADYADVWICPEDRDALGTFPLSAIRYREV